MLDDILCYEVDQILVVEPDETESLAVQEGQDLVMRLGEEPSHMGDVSMEKLYETMRSSHAEGE